MKLEMINSYSVNKMLSKLYSFFTNYIVVKTRTYSVRLILTNLSLFYSKVSRNVTKLFK